MTSRTVRTLAFLAVCLSASTGLSFDIALQYPSGTLFSPAYDSVAKNAINAAAQDVSYAITSNLAAINDDTITGTAGGTSVTFNWSYQYTDPSLGTSVAIENIGVPANTVTMFVGSRNLPNPTLGVGGPAGAGYQVGASYSGAGAFSVAAAMASAESQSEIELRRGGGPVLGTHSNTITLGPQSASFSIDFGIAYGSLSLDWNGTGDGGWHFDHTTVPAAGKNDLYSVAVHEMLHALGIGASDSWESRVSGTSWTGASVVGLVGSGANLLNPTADHIASGTISTNALTGAVQEAAMDPSITQGQRKYLTALDLAFLRDIGYSTIDWATVPTSPADFNNDGHVNAVDLGIWKADYGVGPDGDSDQDGDTDGRDFLVWQREYSSASWTATVAVPEPGAMALLALGGLTLLGRCRSTR